MRCPCHSGLDYEECCQSYHLKKSLPESALQLMRSRYSAYAKHLPDYIMDTTHPENPFYTKDKSLWKETILDFVRHTHFESLKILEFLEGEKEAFVTFLAHMKQNGKDAFLQEKSHFVKEGDRWLYYSGWIQSQ